MKNSADLRHICISVSGCLIALFFVSCSGGGKAGFNNDMAVFQFSDANLQSPAGFFEKVKSIELIPLDNDLQGLLSGSASSDLVIDADDFIIYNGWSDSKISRFSREGKYLNPIGQNGRGPREYINLRGVQLLGDTLLAHFSTNETFIHYYDKEGNFIKTEKFDVSSSDMRKIGSDFLLGRGYGVADPVNRAILKSPQGDKLFFETPLSVPAMGEASPMFSTYNDGDKVKAVYYMLRETFNDTVYMYSAAEQVFRPHVAFDFGDAGVGKNFFKQDSRDKAFQILFNKFEKEGFITTVRYLENDKIRWGEFVQNKETNSRLIYFYEDKERKDIAGEWFMLSEDGMSGFTGSIKQLYNGRFYSILQPDFCLDLPVYVRDKIANPQVLENLGEESNCVIAILDMK